MFEKFLLQVLPQAEEILNFKPEVGRGKVFWVYFKNEFGKASTFLKKKISSWIQKIYATFEQYNWLDMNTVESPSGRVYEVSEYSCSCPDYRHNISQGKSWRTFCKHQLMQMINKFSESIKPQHSIESLLNSPVPEGISISKSIDSDGYFWGLGIRFSYWKPPKTEYGEYKKERQGLGLIRICESAHAHADVGDIETFISRKNLLGKGFNNLDDAIDYLLRYHRLNREMAFEPDEIKALNSLFWNEPEPEPEPETEYPMQEYFEEEKQEESKPTKKWFSLANLQNQEMPF